MTTIVIKKKYPNPIDCERASEKTVRGYVYDVDDFP
jgi:hypothetical protein